MKDFILPDIGEGVVECEVVEWLVAEGDTIVEDQPIADVMTDKALVQIPAIENGVVTKLHYAKGEIAKVHAPLFTYNPEGASAAPAASQTETVAPAVEAQTAPAAASGKVIEDFILPDIGEGVVECELVEWKVAEGDIIEEDQPIADVMTDKAMVEIPAVHPGKVVKLYYQKGEIAKVHSPLFAVEIDASLSSGKASAVESAVESAAANKSVANASAAPGAESQVANNNGKAVASPAVRRVARELNVDITLVPGSGKKGRVYKEDVIAFAEGKAPAAPSCPAKAAPAQASTDKTSGRTPATVPGGTRTEAIRGVKAAMARQMQESVSTIPHFTYCEEIDLTNLIALRLKLKEQYAKQGVRLTLMPFFMKAMSLALRDFPAVNAQVNADCTEMTYFDDHNIGMAVDSKVGLLVPNVKQVNHKSIVEVAQEVSRLTDAAREGRVATEDMKGGTITISNIGAIGGTVATPIINKPESAIVALGKTQALPRFNDKGEVEARQIMQVSWSGDHRIIDGGTIARFCNQWKAYLEEPENMVMAMV